MLYSKTIHYFIRNITISIKSKNAVTLFEKSNSFSNCFNAILLTLQRTVLKMATGLSFDM
jgi:hypothetical protein